jgi:hypothetical protein
MEKIYCSCGRDAGEEHKPFCPIAKLWVKGQGVSGESELIALRAELSQLRTAHDAAVKERDEAFAANEIDRTAIADGIATIRKALKGREWLRLGRGSFEYDDDRWRDEFSDAYQEILDALEPLAVLARDIKLCPNNQQIVNTARALKTRAEKAEAERDAALATGREAGLREAAGIALEHDAEMGDTQLWSSGRLISEAILAAIPSQNGVDLFKAPFLDGRRNAATEAVYAIRDLADSVQDITEREILIYAQKMVGNLVEPPVEGCGKMPIAETAAIPSPPKGVCKWNKRHMEGFYGVQCLTTPKKTAWKMTTPVNSDPCPYCGLPISIKAEEGKP